MPGDRDVPGRGAARAVVDEIASDRMPSRDATVILFDLDGVLVDSTRIVERAWRRWAADVGVPVDGLLAVAHGRPARELVRMFAPSLDPEGEALRVAEYEIADPEGLTVIPGARECVAFASRGRWAVVTSGSRALAAGRIADAGLPAPAVLVTADDVAAGKPDPEPYERAARELGVAAAACIVIEDAPAGVTAGRRAGATVFAVATTHDADSLAQADRVFGTMHEIAEHLRASA
jgi:sugar-phosphatase